MRSRLFWKLLAVQLLAIAVVLALALGVMRARTASSFVAYLGEQQQLHLAQSADELAAAYRRSGDWREAYALLGFAPAPDRHEPPPYSGRRAPSAPRPPRARGEAPTMLATPDGRPLLPRRQPEGFDNGLRAPVVVDGEVVAVLWRPAGPRALMRAEHGFQRRQGRGLLFAVLLALPVALLLSALLARHLLVPIRRLNRAHAALAARDFGARVPVRRNDELGELAEQFNRSAEALDRYESRQQQWLADIAHELRTPLAVLRGELDALHDGVRELTPRAVESLREEVDRLAGLVDDIHLLSMADAGELRLQRGAVDLGELVAEAESRYAGALRDAGFDWQARVPEGLPTIQADRRRLLQLLANLLANVRQHATPGPVRIEAFADGDFVGLRVRDAGPGVAEADLPRLFDRLYRGDYARRRSHGGSGLGLSICRGLVEAHGGRIEASVRDGGLCIECRFPVVPR